MGANHSHGPAAPASRRAVMATLAVLVPLALATVAAMIALWPSPPDTAEPSTLRRETGTITEVTLRRCPKPPPLDGSATAPAPDPATCGDATVKLTSGANLAGTVTLRLPTGPGAQVFAPGDDVILIHDPGAELGEPSYRLSDHDRSSPLWLFGIAFALAVIAFGRWRGLTALLGLVLTFGVLLTFVLPGILDGRPPLLVAIVGSAAIMLTVLFLTHGPSLTTSMAVLGTLSSLVVTGVLSYFSLDLARLTGITDEAAFSLGMSYDIDTQGLLLASIIIGSLGVLDDVTVTQAVTVAELAHANPSYGFRRLYRAAGRVGRAHIASVINTIILAYAGASLPLLLLISVGRDPLGHVLTNPVIAQEIVRSVVGTLGLISAVPITTALSALVARRSLPAAPQPDVHHHHAASR
ncbi:YibE/F family protein [Nonomuraea sp. NBC_01738]|uniref:YibE/F family protein n=1 Tax=Nonomuraea sp. NBC_01738 TaxID=2976003 RepID=UPI002E122372|nr:YibE/F family protein [Nonomuraea sp. NBC_01738]